MKMKRPSSITTCGGDGGYTRLCSGERVPKNDSRLEACGDVDELVCALGLVKACIRKGRLRGDLEAIQRDLFRVGAEISTAGRRSARPNLLSASDVAVLDRMCAFWDGRSHVRDFVLPGNTKAGAALDYARAVARRCERRLVALCRRNRLKNRHLVSWFNRLSDLLWLMARAEEKRSTPLHKGLRKP